MDVDLFNRRAKLSHIDQDMEPEKPGLPKEEEIATGNKAFAFKLDEPVTTALNIPSTSITSANEDDSLSFIVLGKDSVEAQASLLASYVDIQQKSMSIVRTSPLHFYLTINPKMGNENIFPRRTTSRWCRR